MEEKKEKESFHNNSIIFGLTTHDEACMCMFVEGSNSNKQKESYWVKILENRANNNAVLYHHTIIMNK